MVSGERAAGKWSSLKQGLFRKKAEFTTRILNNWYLESAFLDFRVRWQITCFPHVTL
jgi:hypothetical protein